MTAAVMTRIVARLEKLLNPEDELQGWTITRSPCNVRVVMMYRTGFSHTVDISTADQEFINASI